MCEYIEAYFRRENLSDKNMFVRFFGGVHFIDVCPLMEIPLCPLMEIPLCIKGTPAEDLDNQFSRFQLRGRENRENMEQADSLSNHINKGKKNNYDLEMI